MAGESQIRNLLVVVDDTLSLSYLMEKAQRLADGSTNVHVVHVIYEGVADISTSAIEDSARLKTFILESAESALEDELEKWRGRIDHLESATLWNPRTWEGVLHAAADVEADLILRATGEQESLGDKVASVVRTPDEWNLLRHAEVPVMLVKVAAWPGDPVILCALDLFDDSHEDLNRSALRQASELAGVLGGDLDVVYAYPLFEPWVGELGAVKSYTEIKNAVEEEARERMAALVSAGDFSYRHLLLEEGPTAQVLARLVEESEAALLVLGTHAREGVRGVLLGNTSERILHAVDCDVVTVHAT
ncbi:MAG: universal stress protein [Pseudomonadales bacterium]|jgi:universal stress protein E